MRTLLSLIGNVVLLVLAVYALSFVVVPQDHPVPARPPMTGSLHELTTELGEQSRNQPRKTPGMTDQQWCLISARYWEDNGVEVPDDSECQGQPMSHWRAQEGQPA